MAPPLIVLCRFSGRWIVVEDGAARRRPAGLKSESADSGLAAREKWNAPESGSRQGVASGLARMFGRPAWNKSTPVTLDGK